MKNLLFLAIGVFLLQTQSIVKAQEKKQLPEYKYMHMLSPDEKGIKGRIGKSFTETDPPVGEVRNIAEFEPMEGVLVRYPFGIPLTLIKALAEEDTVITIVASEAEENHVKDQYESYNIDLGRCKFLHAASDSYWTRDYGPLFIVDGNDEVGVVNFVYNRPRYNDDEIPMHYADSFALDWYGMNVVHTGGNYMTDGYGISASTTIVYTESEDEGIPQNTVDKRMLDYLGIQKYHVLDDPNDTYIDHIDCWGKFLGVDKILIRSVPKSHAQYDELEEMADYWKHQKSSWGTYYKVYRVYTPNDQPYTNSLILNGRVFVPQSGYEWDDDALEVYRKAMPGYEILGFTGEWLSTDALHCRTHELADRNMLQILHYPIKGYQEYESSYQIQVDIKDLSKKGLYSDSLMVVYRVNEEDWKEQLLDKNETSSYSANISDVAEGDKIEYYIHAADSSGRSENHPYMGRLDPHIFYAGGNLPYLSLSHNEITFSPDNTSEVEFTIENEYNEPIEILSITDDFSGCAVVSERDYEFPLELKTDSVLAFTINPLETTNSKGYITDTLKIETVDSIYRVVINTDESFIQSINQSAKITSKIYPNPFNDRLTVELNINGASNFVSAKVVSSTGVIVDYLSIVEKDEDYLELSWSSNRSTIKQGVYFIVVEFDDYRETFKVIKQK